jgi:hypothetical protein
MIISRERSYNMFTPDDLAETFLVEVAADWNEDTDSSSPEYRAAFKRT